ncbi:MAG: hypothetical protein NZ890_15855 [Myxococcota bacterium]|nr:hypothetical protein [Myxococcota bacterium]
MRLGRGAPLGVMGGEAVSAVRGTGRGGPNLEVVAACLAPCAQGLLRAVAHGHRRDRWLL